jgi:hypothetical protein
LHVHACYGAAIAVGPILSYWAPDPKALTVYLMGIVGIAVTSRLSRT